MNFVKKCIAFGGGIRNIIPLCVMIADKQLRKIVFTDMRRLHYENIYSKTELLSLII